MVNIKNRGGQTVAPDDEKEGFPSEIELCDIE